MTLRVKSDGRDYRLLLEDRAQPRVVHRVDFPAVPPGEWETISMPLSDLQPSVFGDPVNAPAFEPGAAWRLGIMLNDVDGGPFELVVDRVEVCG